MKKTTSTVIDELRWKRQYIRITDIYLWNYTNSIALFMNTKEVGLAISGHHLVAKFYLANQLKAMTLLVMVPLAGNNVPFMIF